IGRQYRATWRSTVQCRPARRSSHAHGCVCQRCGSVRYGCSLSNDENLSIEIAGSTSSRIVPSLLSSADIAATLALSGASISVRKSNSPIVAYCAITRAPRRWASAVTAPSRPGSERNAFAPADVIRVRTIYRATLLCAVRARLEHLRERVDRDRRERRQLDGAT